jgi:hypothetical protein
MPSKQFADHIIDAEPAEEQVAEVCLGRIRLALESRYDKLSQTNSD